METKKTPWRKNLDPRYICGEDLIAEQNGFKKELIVRMSKFNDAPTFDQSKQSEVTKTAIWLIDHETNKPIYKPLILNVTNGEKLSELLGNNSIFMEDWDYSIPFVLYAKPDKRHGFVARCKKYHEISKVDDSKAIAELTKATTLDELKSMWMSLSTEEKNNNKVIAFKEEHKKKLS